MIHLSVFFLLFNFIVALRRAWGSFEDVVFVMLSYLALLWMYRAVVRAERYFDESDDMSLLRSLPFGQRLEVFLSSSILIMLLWWRNRSLMSSTAVVVFDCFVFIELALAFDLGPLGGLICSNLFTCAWGVSRFLNRRAAHIFGAILLLLIVPIGARDYKIVCDPVVTAQRLSYYDNSDGCETLFEYTCINKTHLYWDVSYVDAVDSKFRVVTRTQSFLFDVLPPENLCGVPCCSLCRQFHRSADCCTLEHSTPQSCDGGPWARALRSHYPRTLAYFYAYDDKNGLHFDEAPLLISIYPLGSRVNVSPSAELAPVLSPVSAACLNSPLRWLPRRKLKSRIRSGPRLIFARLLKRSLTPTVSTPTYQG